MLKAGAVKYAYRYYRDAHYIPTLKSQENKPKLSRTVEVTNH